MTRVLVHGAGRMARRVLAQLPGFGNFELLGLVSRTQPGDDIGTDWFESFSKVNKAVDLLIDFTLPGGTRLAAEWCSTNSVALLSGTTGLTGNDVRALENAALNVPVLWAPNLSHGVALMTSLVRQAANVLGVSANISISDIHHQHKKDAPSGTALALAAATQEGRSGRLQSLVSADRQAEPSAGVGGDITFSSLREGEVVGEHTVSFTMGDEVLEITHRALDRDVFAKGALKAGKWLVKQAPGYYSTADWMRLT